MMWASLQAVDAQRRCDLEAWSGLGMVVRDMELD
jgi:hypothetical protein